VRDPQKLKPIPEPKTPEQLLGDCRISAMLVALATAEGTAADADGGYGRGVGGTVLKSPNNPALVGQTNVTITDFSQHPNILVQVNANLTSTAAGRYQFLYGTWSGLNLGDFGSHNQNVGAVMLLQQVGSIKPLLKGHVAQAVSNANEPGRVSRVRRMVSQPRPLLTSKILMTGLSRTVEIRPYEFDEKLHKSEFSTELDYWRGSFRLQRCGSISKYSRVEVAPR
jgi:hypothetical protein